LLTEDEFHGDHEPKNFAKVLVNLEGVYKKITHVFNERHNTEYVEGAIEGGVKIEDLENLQKEMREAAHAIEMLKKHMEKDTE
jgi:hypothetical protein